MTPSPDAKPGRRSPRSPRSSPPRTQRSPSSTERRRLEAPGAVDTSPVPLATLPKAKAAPRSAASPQAQEDGEPPKRKKRRRKDKINDEDAPGVMPKAAAAPKEVGDPAGPDPGALPEEPVGIQEARPKRRTRKVSRAGEASEAKAEEPAPEAPEKEGAAPADGKEGKKRRKRRVANADAKEDEGGEAKPEGEMRVDDQAVLIAAVEELAPGQAEANAAEAPKTKRRRKRKIAAAEMQPLELTGDGATAEGSEVNERYSALIRGVYQRHNPAKLNEVESLLIKYQGMEAELYHRVCEKYQETPQEPTEPGPPHNAEAAAPASRVAAGEAWPFEENEVSMNSESSSSSQAGDDAETKIVIPPVSGIFDAVETNKGPENSPSSPSSRRSAPADDLMQRFTSLAEPKPGGDARVPVEVRQELPAWAQPPDRPPERPPNGRQDHAIPAWALPQDAPPGDWGRPYPSYGRMGGAPPGPPGPPGWGGKGWGYPGYPALPAPQAQRSWADSIGSAWAQ